MRVVLQRVLRAEVRIDGHSVGRIGRGFLLLVGFGRDDGDDAGGPFDWMADKIIGLRLFADDEGRMNRSLEQVGGDLLVVSQFTLLGDVAKGRRPSFIGAAEPARAEALYDRFVDLLRERLPGRVQTGEFGAMMMVELVNDGPVTLVLER